MGCFVRGDKNSMGCFVWGCKSMLDVLSGMAKNGMGCFVPGCFVLHSAICVGGNVKNMFFCMRIDILHVKEQIFYKRWQDIWFKCATQN